MTARVLVVDDVDANVKLLEARLTAEYFEVRTARSGPEGLHICARERADVILLDVMMPGMDGFEVCRRLKSEPRTQHIPVIMITALDQPSDRVRGLEAGADDFLTKPVDDIALITRVKNLARLKMLTDEMLMRASTEEQMGFAAAMGIRLDQLGRGGRILLVEDRDRSADRIIEALQSEHHVEREADPARALLSLPDGNFDLMIVSLSLEHADGLRLCSQVRSLDRTGHLPIMIIIEPGDDARLLRGLDMGVNDYIVRPVDSNELLARVRTQVKRKRYTDHLRTRLEETVEMAILDPLTALHNRRYMTSHLKTLFDESSQRGSRSRCSCWTSTISRRSTTATAMTREIRCCANSLRASAAIFAASIWPAGLAGAPSATGVTGLWPTPLRTSPRRLSRPSANHPWPLREPSVGKSRFPDFMWRLSA
jgi:two-component system cell cycle response regulator